MLDQIDLGSNPRIIEMGISAISLINPLKSIKFNVPHISLQNVENKQCDIKSFLQKCYFFNTKFGLRIQVIYQSVIKPVS